MKLNKKVSIAGRFLRSVRVDQDNNTSSLESYVFPQSLQELLLGMAEQQGETGQGAYTWTGPYGSGKSSLALALTSLLSGTNKQRKKAAELIGPEFAEKFWKQLPPQSKGWQCVSLIGQRGEPHQVVAQSLKEHSLLESEQEVDASSVVQNLLTIAQSSPKSSGGLVLIIDEMGKFLESAALSNGDVYFFQLLAEAASRSNGRLIVVGILHQAFQEYANRLAREARDEWSKIQGRYVDLPVNISGEEQIELISRAIECTENPKNFKGLCEKVAEYIRKNRPAFGQSMGKTLSNSWPLNPITTTLLGPISRRSYGQNQRSIFSFLGSSEGLGFQDFLRQTDAEENKTFTPSNLWDYLIFNLESSIAVSPDSHHFSAAKDAIFRCQKTNGNPLESEIIKTIALLELSQQQTGLGADLEVLQFCLPHASLKSIKEALESLEQQSIVIFKKFRDVYALFEGSDFDIEDALNRAYHEVSAVDLSSVTEALAISSLSAKRHYHETGALRWCELKVVPVNQLEQTTKSFMKKSAAFGLFVLALPTENENSLDISKALSTANKAAKSFDLVAAVPQDIKNLLALAKDRTALSHIMKNDRAIQRDKIARREVRDRLEAISGQIEQEVWKLFNDAEWHIGGQKKRQLTWTALNSLTSELADKRFHKSPKLHNELLNRIKPSGTANGALKALLHHMILDEGKEGLGIEKYPAHKGLFVSLIEHNNLYQFVDNDWRLVPPSKNDKANLFPLWEATRQFMAENSHKSVNLEELYNLWRNAPFGVKDGILPLLAVLFMITEHSSLAYYREKIFLSQITDVDIDYLLKAPDVIQIRWMDMSDMARTLLANMANTAAELTGEPVLNLEPLDVGRALIQAYENAAPWVKRTSRLSKNAVAIRNLFKRSNDPNKFIFDDIPGLYAEQTDVSTVEGIEFVSEQIKEGLEEILAAYEVMLSGLRTQVLAELQVHSRSPQAYKDLNERAENIKGISGNLRLEAFVNRLTMLDDSLDQMESLAGLAINKPSKNWIDSDLDRAAVELMQLAQDFNKHETVARVKGRKDKRDAMAIVVGMDGRPKPLLREFDILEGDRSAVTALAKDIKNLLETRAQQADSNLLLAALATASAMIINENGTEEENQEQNRA
ncbi:hypothetical protein [Emcibacter sp.]|uniref:hypothetical protein n=1 Tax=Emcibacter sp. TaxID=1979954 RepID=UPI002AA76A05|nr:hypothetical protein [Emcibacter sp.]